MPRKPSTAVKTGSVQKFIGTAYDNMKELKDNIPWLQELHDNLDNSLKYLGGHGTPPTTRLDGSELQGGDYYFDTVLDALVYYDNEDGSWFSVDPNEVLAARDAAINAQISAESSRDDARAAETGAETAQGLAELAQGLSENAQAKAETAQSLAETAQAGAETAETNAQGHATTAEAEAANAAADATNTAADVLSSGSNASDAASHATSAQNSATAAQLAQQQAEQAFENFDDRYLGAFASHPSTDNDGDPLAVGTTYFNTTEDLLYYYNGAQWESPDKAASDSAAAAAASAATATTQAGNAANSATASLNAKTDSVAAKNAAEDAQAAAETAEVGAEAAETAAQASALAASTSETNAANSETAAGTSEVNAESAKTSAEAAQAAAEAASINGMGTSQAQFDAMCEQRKREGAGSGFAEWGKHASSVSFPNVNEGIWTLPTSETYNNAFRMGRGSNSFAGDSRTHEPIAVVDGVQHNIESVATSNEDVFNLVKFPTAPDGAKSLNATTGEVHKYHDLAGVGEEYEAYTVDFDGNTYIDLTDEPYVMPINSTVTMKVKWNGGDEIRSQYLLDSNEPRIYLYRLGSDSTLNFLANMLSVKVNGVEVNTGTLVIEENVEYLIEATVKSANSFEVIGSRYSIAEFWNGEIWDVEFASSEEGVAPIQINTSVFQPKADAAPVVAAIDAGDNPDMPAGYQPLYAGSGRVDIPAFPIADNMDISITLRTDINTRNQMIGTWQDGGSRLGFYADFTSTNDFDLRVGNGAFSFPALIPGKVYPIHVQLRRREGATGFDVTVTVDGQEQTSIVTFNRDIIDDFRLGGAENYNYPWDGQIWDFKIEYPDTPDLNREYSSIEGVDPAGRLTVEDDLGFTTEDWTPDISVSDTSYVDITDWAPSGHGNSYDFTYEAVIKFDTVGSSHLTGQLYASSGSNHRLYMGTQTGFAYFGYGTAQSAFDSAKTIEAGKEYHYKMVVNALTADCYVDGVLIGTLNTSTSAVNNLIIGGILDADGTPTANHISGSIRDVRLTDNINPENSRHYPLVINSPSRPTTLVAEDVAYDKDTAPFYTPDYGDASSTFVRIPTWQSNDSVIKFKAIWDGLDNRSYHFILDTDNETPRVPYLFVSDAAGGTPGAFQFGSNMVVYLNGVIAEDNVTLCPVGEEFEIEITTTGTTTVDYFGRFEAGGLNGWNGKIWDIELTDNTDATNSRYYPSLVYSPDAPHTGTVLEEEYGLENRVDESNYRNSFGGDSAWTIQADRCSCASLGGYNKATMSDVAMPPVVAGTRIIVTYTVENHTGGDGHLRIVNTSNFPYYSGHFVGNGDYSAELVWQDANGTFDNVHFQDNQSFTGDITNIVVKFIYDGTLVNFPVNNEWTLAQTDEQQTAGTLENFTVGSEWDNDLPSTDGTMVGFSTPWFYESGRYDVNIIGNTTMKPMSLQDSQKCFLEAKYTGFEPIISRKDLVFLETWKEDVSLKDIVTPLGNTQYGATTYDGLPTSGLVGLGVGQGYSAFGEWDESTQGLGWKWSHLTIEQQRKILDDPKHNLVWNTEDQKLYQHRYRIRVVEGLGDDWETVRPTDDRVNGWFAYRELTNSVYVRGEATTVTDLGSLESRQCFAAPDNNYSQVDGDSGAWSNRNDVSKGLPIALVQRLNSGAYSPEYNPSGCRHMRSSNNGTTTNLSRKWYEPFTGTPTLDSTESCFKVIESTASYGELPAASSASGYIGAPNATGRSDQYEAFDAIYAGQVEDLRLNANKQDESKLLADAVRRGVRGETRGKGKVPFTTNMLKAHAAVAYNQNGVFSVADGTDLLGNLDWVGVSGDRPCIGIIYVDGEPYEVSKVNGYNVDGRTYIWTTYPNVANGQTITGWLGQELSASYDSLPWVDIIGDPERIAATFPDGVVGEWLSLIPNGTLDNFPLNEKSNVSSATVIFTNDDGSTWTSTTAAIDTVSNEMDYNNFPANRVGLINYEALSDFTESDDNRAVVGNLGDVEVSCVANLHPDWGSRVSNSVLDIITKSGGVTAATSLGVNSHLIDGRNGKLYNGQAPKHEPLFMPQPSNDSKATKTLPHLVEKDGLLYVQWHGTELVWESSVWAGNWVAGETKNVEAGQVYLLTGFTNTTLNDRHFIVEEDATGITFSSTTFSGWYLSDDGYIRTISGGTFSLLDMKLFNPTNAGWGDDSEITIVDDESTKTDRNGNEVKVVTHTHMIPIGIAHKNETK